MRTVLYGNKFYLRCAPAVPLHSNMSLPCASGKNRHHSYIYETMQCSWKLCFFSVISFFLTSQETEPMKFVAKHWKSQKSYSALLTETEFTRMNHQRLNCYLVLYSESWAACIYAALAQSRDVQSNCIGRCVDGEEIWGAKALTIPQLCTHTCLEKEAVVQRRLLLLGV